MIVIPRLQICYQNIPKVATTSLFRWFFDCLKDGGLFVDDDAESRKRFVRDHFKGKTPNAFEIDSDEAAQQEFPGYFSFAITRDPIKRYLSMYSNRVIFHKKLAKADISNALRQRGLSANPDINEMALNLSSYRDISRDVRHHSAPMVEFLSQDLGVYQHIVDIGSLDALIDAILEHWRKCGLDSLAASAPLLGRSQTGGPKLGLEALSEEAFESLLSFYRQDYAKIPTIALEQITAAYHSARADSSAQALPSGSRHSSPKTRLPELSEKTAAIHHSSATAEVAKQSHDSVSNSIISFAMRIVKGPTDGSVASITGSLVLAHDQLGWTLWVVDDAGERPVEWGIKSPGVGKQFPEFVQARAAKFRAQGLHVSGADKPLELRLKDPAGVERMTFVVGPRGE